MDRNDDRKKRLRKAIISLLIIVAAAVIVVSVARIPEDEAKVPEREEVLVNVEIRSVRPIPSLPDILQLPGSLEPFRVVSVPVEQDGRIAELLAGEGQALREGDLILRLDSALLEAEYSRAKAQADFDRRTLERSTELLERGVFNRSQIEEAEAKAAVSGAILQVAATNLQRATVNAPVGGILNDLPVEAGEWVSRGDPVAQIVEVGRMKVVIQVPERDVHYLRSGSSIRMTVDALDDRPIQGQVSYISEIADDLTRTTRVEVTVENSMGLLRGGMIVRTQIQRRTIRNAIMIPLSSIIPLEDGRIVYVVSENRAEQRRIELGVIKGSQAQVLQGLQEGDALVVAGHRQIGPGQLVNVVRSD
jgi:membrane fusion protein (multidrug efflux system)